MKLEFLNKLKSRFINYYKQETKKNSSYWFILPYFGLDNNKLFSYNLINTYLHDHTAQYQYPNCLHLLFQQPKFNLGFNKYIEQLRQHPNYIDSYDVIGSGTFMVVFDTSEILDILKLFKQGKYSEFPEDFKEKYFIKYSADGKLTHRWKVFQKHEDMKKIIEEKIGQYLPEGAEVWDIPIPEKEIYYYNQNVETLW